MPAKGKEVDQRQLDILALGLGAPAKTSEVGEAKTPEEVPKASLAKDKLLEEAQRAASGGLIEGKKAVSIVVIGNNTPHFQAAQH